MSISLHPGAINTDLTRYSGTLVQRLGRMIAYSVSYGAISSLYAGTAPAARELNGKVRIPTPELAHVDLHVLFLSISPAGHGSHFQIVRHWIPSWERRCGIGVKSRSKTSSPYLATFRALGLVLCTSLSCLQYRSLLICLVL